jgi:hypothetical protein
MSKDERPAKLIFFSPPEPFTPFVLTWQFVANVRVGWS